MFFFILVALTILTESPFDDEVEGSSDEQIVFFIFLFQNHRLVKVINECQKSYNNIDAKRNVRYKRKTFYCEPAEFFWSEAEKKRSVGGADKSCESVNKKFHLGTIFFLLSWFPSVSSVNVTHM